MLFGPLWVGDKQHLELCASNLGEGDITAIIHFRNATTGEVTAGQPITIPSGGGDCAYYSQPGRVVGMARGDGRASDWVSPCERYGITVGCCDWIALANATASLTPAAGGVPTFGGGTGGAGAILGTTGRSGSHPTQTQLSFDVGGGGGGGLGFVQTYTANGVAADVHPQVSSPGFQPNLAVTAR